MKSRCRLRKAPAPKRRFSRSGQVDRGRRTPREEERPGAPRSASATPARQRDRQRPPHADQRRAKAVKKAFDAPTAISSVVPSQRFPCRVIRMLKDEGCG